MEMFANRRLRREALAGFGFVEHDGEYIYRTEIMGGEFMMWVHIDGDGGVRTELVDADGEEYVLHRNEGAAGAFVGAVREAHNQVLQRIVDSCFEQDAFRQLQARRLIERVRQELGDELEFLWTKLPLAAVWRRQDSRKWYGVIMTVTREKLAGLGGEATLPVEIIDLHCRAEDMAGRLAAGARPGYHMNKKYWYSVVLEEEIGDELLWEWLLESRELAGRAKSRRAGQNEQ